VGVVGNPPQVFVSAKSPVTLMEVTVTATFPLLMSVSDCGGLVVWTACAVKLSVAGARLREPAESTPFPVTVM